MNVAAEPITLLVEKNKLQAFLEMLKLFDFVEVESLEAKINRFIKNAPENVPFSEDEIMNLVKETRNSRKLQHG